MEKYLNAKTKPLFQKTCRLLIYLGFLFPRGFLELSSIYKLAYTALIWGSVLLILLQFILHVNGRIRIKQIPHNRFFIYGFFAAAFLLTLINKRGLGSGLQQVIAYPLFVFYILYDFPCFPEEHLDLGINVLGISGVINMVTEYTYFSDKFHTVFLGHIQLVSQMGTLLFFMMGLYLIFHHFHLERMDKYRLGLYAVAMLWNMLTSNASSSLLSALLIMFAVFLFMTNRYHFLVSHKAEYYIGWMLGLSAIVVLITISGLSQITFSERDFIWAAANKLIGKRLLIGYGIDGVLIQSYWTPVGFNYAHNQLVQNLLDGGLILTILFWMMIWASVRNVRKTNSVCIQFLVNTCLIVYLVIACFDSPSIYPYFYAFLAMAAVLQDLPQSILENISDEDRPAVLATPALDRLQGRVKGLFARIGHTLDRAGDNETSD